MKKRVLVLGGNGMLGKPTAYQTGDLSETNQILGTPATTLVTRMETLKSKGR